MNFTDQAFERVQVLPPEHSESATVALERLPQLGITRDPQGRVETTEESRF